MPTSTETGAPGCVAVVLTFNCAAIIRSTITQALKVTPRVLVVDSFSSDDTCTIARELGCEVVQHPFKDYASQRNFAVESLAGRCRWQLHLDADEVLDDRAVASIRTVLEGPAGAAADCAYLLKRRDYFMGRELRFSGLSPWHLRLFPDGQGRCENRLYDQHFISPLPVRRLPGLMHDKNSQTLTEWVARHNRWSDLEAAQVYATEHDDGQLQPALFGDPRRRVRYFKSLYYKLPGGVRSLAYFVYRYVLRGGFLDGQVGFYFALFQALWFRSLVDAKLFELSTAAKGPTN